MLIGIVFGGESFEHEISIISAIAVKNVINENLNFIFCDYLVKYTRGCY